MDQIYDVAIIGCGPAGLSASIYASRYRLKNIVFGKMIGGTIADAHKVCNYPGLPDVSGLELGMSIHKQATDLGAEFSSKGIADIKKENGLFVLTTDQDKKYFSKTVLLATGTKRNKLAIPNEDKYLGKGLSYCATCDAAFYRGKTVGVVGGSSAATMAASVLADVADQVYIIYRGEELRGEPAWVAEIEKKSNIEVLLNTVLVGLEGENKLERVKLSKSFNNSEYLELDGLFIEIGSEANATLSLKLGLELDEKQYIKVNQAQETSKEGIWAAGDCTTNSNMFQQVVTAVSEGAVAINSIYVYIKENQ